MSSSFLCVPHRPCSDGCPLECGERGAGKEGFGVQSSLYRGTLGSHFPAASSEEQVPGWCGAGLGRTCSQCPAEFELR